MVPLLPGWVDHWLRMYDIQISRGKDPAFASRWATSAVGAATANELKKMQAHLARKQKQVIT